MAEVESLQAYAGQLAEAAAKSKAASGVQHEIVHGDAHTDVVTDNGLVPSFAKQARLYSEAVPDAANELSAQMADGRIHDTEAEGRLAVADGKLFYVKGPNSKISRQLYKRINADTSVLQSEDSSAEEIQQVTRRFRESKRPIFAAGDRVGHIAFLVRNGLIKAPGVEVSTDRVRFGNNVIKRTDRFAFAEADRFGFVRSYIGRGGNSGGGSSADFNADDILKANQQGLLSSANVVREYNTEVARPIWDYNHFMEYGQSLSTGFEGWPALSRTPKYGNVMLGESVRPASKTAGAFTPIGGPILTPLKAVVQDLATGATVLTDAEVAGLAPGAGNEGECTVVGMTNMSKKLHNQRAQQENDTSRTFVASCSGVAGQPIERLMKGDSTNRWLRLTQIAAKVKAAAQAESKSYGIVAVTFLQGEFNYSTNWGGVATKDEYKAKLATLYSDVESEVVSAIAGQQQPPLFLTYQTGASYTRDTNDLAIGMAQWELAEERENWVMATPVYPYPDKGGHLTANGYRWVGKQFAKVWHRVVEQGQNWKPLSPLQAQIKGREVLLSLHVPHPPLVFDKPIVGRTPTDYPSKGFSALDDSGDIGVLSASIVADCVVRLRLARDPVGPVFIRYADSAHHQGNGCLRDSDPTMSDDVYEYTAGTGQYADENIPSLVGKPYPLHNWCIAFHIPTVGV